MECRILLLLAFAVCGSYAYSYYRGGGYGYGGYGPGFHGPPRDAYIQGAMYHGDSFSSSDEDARRFGRRGRHHESSSSSEDHSESEESEEHEPTFQGDRFQVSWDYDNVYMDEEGLAQSFLIDLMHAVCRRAGRICRFIVDDSTHCWQTEGAHERPGKGLLDGYYVGCLGYWPTPTRRNSFNFTVPFTPRVDASLHFKEGTTHEHPNTVTGLKIGFVSGSALSPTCFERQEGFTGNKPGKYTPVFYETHEEMIAALQAGEVNGAITVDSFNDAEIHTSHVPPAFHCTQAGKSVMAMKLSAVIDWWNDAFQSMVADGSYRRLCERAERVHGGSHGHVTCLE